MEVLFTPIADLPAEGFPRLRSLASQDCGLRAAQQRAFRLRHPECVIVGAVDDAQLQEVLQKADRLVLVNGGAELRNDDETVLFDTADAAEIARVVAMLHVVEDEEPFHCRCFGSPTLVFHAAGQELAALGVHHGLSVRWVSSSPGGWASDARLTRDSGDRLVQWLAAHGAPWPRVERMRARARA